MSEKTFQSWFFFSHGFFCFVFLFSESYFVHTRCLGISMRKKLLQNLSFFSFHTARFYLTQDRHRTQYMWGPEHKAHANMEIRIMLLCAAFLWLWFIPLLLELGVWGSVVLVIRKGNRCEAASVNDVSIRMLLIAHWSFPFHLLRFSLERSGRQVTVTIRESACSMGLK